MAPGGTDMERGLYGPACAPSTGASEQADTPSVTSERAGLLLPDHVDGEYGGMAGGMVFVPGVPSLALRAWIRR